MASPVRPKIPFVLDGSVIAAMAMCSRFDALIVHRRSQTLFDQDQPPTGSKCSTHFASVSAGKAAIIRSSTSRRAWPQRSYGAR
jgi:hypothetical protein